jgi:hypothetical protein
MARAIDPTDPKFVNTSKLFGGKYADRALCEVGTTIDGLIYLHQLSIMGDPPAFARGLTRQMIELYLDSPDRQEALGLARQQPKGKRRRK